MHTDGLVVSILTHIAGTEVSVAAISEELGRWISAELRDADSHLSGLQVQQAGLVHNVAQVEGQVGREAVDLELRAPDVRCHLNQLVVLKA